MLFLNNYELKKTVFSDLTTAQSRLVKGQSFTSSGNKGFFNLRGLAFCECLSYFILKGEEGDL